jgi:nucleoside-diphosphate-sugar epimerase
MPCALIVGPRSMLGGRLAECLRELGWQVIGVGRSADCEVPLDLAADTLRLDYPGLQADVLFHCAAAFGDDSPEGSWLNERVNALGSLHVLALARAAACKQIIYAGSVSSAPAGDRARLGSYGASKARGEEVLAWGAALGEQQFVSLRFAQLYDERGECIQHQRWFARIVSYARAGLNLRLPPGEVPRNFIHVRDAVAAMVAAAETGWQGVLNVCHPHNDSYLSIAQQTFEVFGQGGEVLIAEEKPPFHNVYFPAVSPELEQLVLQFTGMREGLCEIRDRGHALNFEVFDVA